jgi:hypothetical protein
MCSAIAYLPWLILELIFIGEPDPANLPGRWTAGAAIIGVWMSFALMSAVIATCASQAYLGDKVDVAAAVRRALPRLPRVLVAALLRYVLLFIGLMALIFGSLYVVARFFALMPVIILEDGSIGAAFARTTELSKGRKWHILNTLGLVGIIYWLLSLGVSMVGLLLHNFIVQVTIGAVYTILAYPVIAITEALVYYDARIRSEGLDIELMTGELGGTVKEPVSP